MKSLTLGSVVLCGGESRRMGLPKADLPFGNELLIERVVRLLGELELVEKKGQKINNGNLILQQISRI